MVPGALSSATRLRPSRVLPARGAHAREAKDYATEDRAANKLKFFYFNNKLFKFSKTAAFEIAETSL